MVPSRHMRFSRNKNCPGIQLIAYQTNYRLSRLRVHLIHLSAHVHPPIGKGKQCWALLDTWKHLAFVKNASQVTGFARNIYENLPGTISDWSPPSPTPRPSTIGQLRQEQQTEVLLHSLWPASLALADAVSAIWCFWRRYRVARSSQCGMWRGPYILGWVATS